MKIKQANELCYSHFILGSVPFLIQDGINGLVYPSGDIDALYEKVKYLLDKPEEQERLDNKFHGIG